MISDTEEVVKIVLDELRDRGLIKENQRSAYSSTELLLYNRKNLENAIHENDTEIAELREYGLPKKSASIISMSAPSGGTKENDFVVIEDRISKLEQSTARTKAILRKIDRLIKQYDSPKYPDLLKRIYFDGKTREECAEIYSCDVATVSRNKSKIINNIKVVLFPNDVVGELGC